MNYQLLVLDIDGTAANSRKEVTDRTREAVIRIQRKGIRVVLASGRPPEGVLPIAAQLGLPCFGSYILAFNGARIIESKSGSCIFEKRLPAHIPSRILEDARRAGVGMAVYQPGRILAGTRPDRYMRQESQISGLPIQQAEGFGRELAVSECLLTGPPEDMEALQPVLAHKYFHEAQVFQSEPWYLEVTPKNVDKAYGLKHLLRILKIPREAMVCCGDSYNDVSMLQYAGLGAAMANAAEPVKLVADFVTSRDNDHDGAAEVIERFF